MTLHLSTQISKKQKIECYWAAELRVLADKANIPSTVALRAPSGETLTIYFRPDVGAAFLRQMADILDSGRPDAP